MKLLLILGIAGYVLAQQPEKGTKEYKAYNEANCRNFSFNVRFDAYPSDFDIILQNELDGELIWQDDHKYFEGQKYMNASDSVCLLPDECWRVTIFDSPIFQDGLTKVKGEKGSEGAYTLKYGGQVIGTNNGTNCFETEWYLFGNCGRARMSGSTGGELCEDGSEVKVDEVVVEEQDPEFCVRFEVSVTLDEFPEDMQLVLVDSYGLTVWDKRPWTQKNQGGAFREMTCLDLDLCYNFTIFDSKMFPYGLTEGPEGGQPGEFSIRFNKQIIAEYDGENDGCYESRWYQIGVGCPFMSGGISPMECPVVDFVEDKAINCKVLNFTIVADEFPEDTVYILTDRYGREIWNEQPWTLLDQNELFQRDICLDPDDCYTLVVYDSDEHQDGLSQPPKDGVPGSIKVEYDNLLVGAYDGATDGCFAAIGFRFGNQCPGGTFVTDKVGDCKKDEEEGDSKEAIQANEEECVGLQFQITTDEFPEDSHLSLVNLNGKELWNERAWTQKNIGQKFDRDICLDPNDCYNFTITDSMMFQDGLTVSPPGGVPGKFNLTFGPDIVGYYDGATDGCFLSKWFTFGHLCHRLSSGTNSARCPPK